MSEQNKMNVEAVLDTKDLYEQLNKQKAQIKVDVDTAYLSSQIQSALSQVGNVQPIKIPVEIDQAKSSDNIKDTISLIGSSLSGIAGAFAIKDSLQPNLD